MSVDHSNLLKAVANHLILPPDLAGTVDKDLADIDRNLLQRVRAACSELKAATKGEFDKELDSLGSSLEHCGNIHHAAHLDSLELQRAFRRLNAGEILIVHVYEQNAGLLIRHGSSDLNGYVIFEAFEVSAKSETVLACQGALQWDFPTSAAAIPYGVFAGESFQQHLAELLEKGSHESIKRFSSVTIKAKSSAYESRDTSDPALITAMLISSLEGIGQRVELHPIRKRVRDEVRWEKACPWRRSPLWLLVRVGVLRHFDQSTGTPVSNALYKALMCLVHARLLEQAVGSLSPHLSHLILRKLCLRIAKLEKDNVVTADSGASSKLNALLASLRPILSVVTQDATKRLENAWNNYKSVIQRRVTPFKTRNAHSEHLKLKLVNSTTYFEHLRRKPLVSNITAGTYSMRPSWLHFFKKYSDLTQAEAQLLARDGSAVSDSSQTWDELVEQLAAQITAYISQSKDCYAIGTEERSRMILTVVWLWVLMDNLLCQHMPEFSRFKPIFGARVLDCLRLSSYPDLRRLQQVQSYLIQRHTLGANADSSRTILDTPVSGCFADRYYDCLSTDSAPHELAETIHENEEKKQQRKKDEWDTKDTEHKRLNAEISALACQYSFVGPQFVPDHDDDHCQKCILTRKARRIRIERMEKAMPYNKGQENAVLFELTCPPAFANYRNAVWAIVATLGLPNVQKTKSEPVTMVYTYYSRYCKEARSHSGKGMTLASRTKSFLQTHYQFVGFPIPFDEVTVNNGLRFEFYDNALKLWPAEHLQQVTFRHHCMIPLPPQNPLAKIPFPDRIMPDKEEAALIAVERTARGRTIARYLRADAEITSNEILAALPRCPYTLGVSEFTGFQTLICGSRRLWLTFLVELASSNLNFSSYAVMALSQALICRTGTSQGTGFHVANETFRDDVFCETLLDQIHRRLQVISSNPRENICMETMLSLVLKTLHLGSAPVHEKALELLELARGIALEWMRSLRTEALSSIDGRCTTGITEFIVWAAVLCRRTFTLYSQGIEGLPNAFSTAVRDDSTDSGRSYISPSALAIFLEASLAFDEYQPTEQSNFTPLLSNALIRDVKMVSGLRHCLQTSLTGSPRSLVVAAVQANIMSNNALLSCPTSISFEEHFEGVWARVEIPASLHMSAQIVDFHLLAGTILLNGKPVERELPPKLRSSPALARLFPNQRPVVYPSVLSGMTYMLAFPIEGNEIHFGFRQGTLVIRAWSNGTLLEYIPDNVFVGANSLDLPAPLIDGCVHWLNLHSNVIEIRKMPKIWRPAPAHWRIDLNSRLAMRRGTALLDHSSSLFRHFANVFRGFEDPRYIIVCQPQQSALSVELRRFELTFFVNANRFLECRQLRAEIDENQDAGTFYGLSSKIVLRDIQNPRQRSIIVPLGPLTIHRNGMHVDVQVDSKDRVYARYFLDDTLGRVTCASEPRLFYTKALLHACTSFCFPDPLTGKTGTDEACHILESGSSQPYSPLTQVNDGLLKSIAKLSPVRQFHPPEFGVLEMVSWDTNLTVNIQDDRYWPLVERIKQKSDLLSLFEVKEEMNSDTLQPITSMDTATADCPNALLAQRSVARRRLYQPPETIALSSTVGQETLDHIYNPRGYARYQLSQDHVFQMTHLINKWPAELPSPFFLDLVFQNWAFIAGYGDEAVKKDLTRLSDCLEVDLASSWGPLVNLYRAEGQDSKYKLLFWTALICFNEEINMGAIQTLVAFAILNSLKKLDLPSWPSYTQFRPDFRPKVDYLRTLLAPCGRPFSSGDMRSRTQKERKAIETARCTHQNEVTEDLDGLAQFMCAQWPCPQPSLEKFSTTVLDLDMASALIAVEWSAMFQNHEFEEHLRQVRDLLHMCRCPSPIRTTKLPAATLLLTAPRGFPLIRSNKLQGDGLRGAKPSPGPGASLVASKAQAGRRHAYADIEELKRIVDELPQVKSVIRQKYRRGLLDSIAALEKYRERLDQRTEGINIVQLNRLITDAENSVQSQFAQLAAATKTNQPGAMWLDIAGLWPVTTYCSVLETLRSTNPAPLTALRTGIVNWALSITRLQRLLRIQDASWRQKAQQVDEETRNPGHSNWNPMEYPDWLLLEIDANILIRPIQVDVALATINPASGTNSVLQLNMGQGKTSTIIPLVAAVLADGKSLCRVVVPKALLLQTAQLLQLRLGGLLGRELRHVPFSRRSPSDCDTIRAYGNIHRDISRSSGVIIALPEHMMSFMLSGQQRLLDERTQEAGQMIKVQDWLLRKSRDIFDECDFTMAVKTQLIYPSGPQVIVDGGNYRWEAIETVLQLAESHLKMLECTYESSIQVVARETGGFPFFYFLRNDVQDALIQCIATDVCTGRTSLLNADNYSAADKQAIKAFITEPSPQKFVISRVSDIHRGSQADGYVIYLLRGLLVHRILVLTLSRRWNINFGLNPSRDPISVPFLAKGIPSQLAEWGHVDVSLLFTCLSFYHQGLSQDQLKQSLDQIVKSDDPAREYEQWWSQESTTVSDRHRDWASINLEDSVQLNEIWLGVRHSIAAVNHFMNNFVFPKHAKQFKVKLQASGWDLPLAGSGRSLTTGFSGTNDNRLALPLTIKQADLEGLAHTNAEVLTLLLHARNRSYCLAGFPEHKYGRSKYYRMSEQQLLMTLRDQRIRVLIDSGALVLESTNEAVAKTWLDIDTEAIAAIYFADDNRAMVLYRAGRKLPLLASPFAEDLTHCLVYLDEAHTRGTDMKFPPFARGAITLSLGQTKDHTVQGVGRLRMLSSTQAVTFFAPPEVHRSILDFRGKGDRSLIDSHDVICWLLEQTCQGLENLQPLYYGQGLNYCRRIQAARDHPQYLDNPVDRQAYLDALRTHEQQSLKVLYEPRSEKPRRRVRDEKFDESMLRHIKELEHRRKAFQDTGNAVHASALQEVEQEREVAVEVETVRQKQNRLFFSPQNFSGLAERIREFVMTGSLRTDYTMFEDRIFETAFSYMARTATSLKYPAGLPETPQLFVSAEFCRAVAVTSGRPVDDFLRPVQWILWSKTTEKALIVSPEEAELLIPLCRTATKQLVHLLTYAAPVTQKMLPFSELNYYAIPTLPAGWSAPMWLKVQIGVFAGRLYFPFQELQPIRELLGLNDERINDDFAADLDELRLEDESPSDGNQTSADGERHDARHTDEIRQARAVKVKATKMLRFLHAWLATRSRGQDFTHTPMGYICAGKELTKDHPFFRAVDQNEALRKETRNAATDENPQFPETAKDEEPDNASDIGDEDVDERQKLTEEELKQSEEMAAMAADDVESDGDDGEDDDESDSSGFMFGD